MPLSLQSKYLLAAVTFLVCGVCVLVFQQPILLIIPFAIIVIPPVVELCASKPHILFYALIALLPWSTEVNLTPSLGLDFPAEILMMLLSGLMILKIIFQPGTVPKQVIQHPIVLLLSLHFIWICIASIFSTTPLLSLKFILAKLWFILPFVLLPSLIIYSKKHFIVISRLLLFSMGVVVIIALVRHAFFHFSFEAVKEIYSPFFRNHVNFSAMLVCLMAVLFCSYRLSVKQTRKLLLICLIIAFLALVFAYSRGAWLALIIGIAAGWLISRRLIIHAIFLTILLTCACVFCLKLNNNYLQFAPDFNTTIFHEDFNEHMRATVEFRDVSNAERFYRWVAGANMIEEKPLTGFGPNSFYSNYKSYSEVPFKTWVSNNPEHSTVHNYFLLVAIEQGIPGLFLFCMFYFALIVYSQKLYHHHTDKLYKQIAITIGVMLVMIGILNFVSDLIETDKIGSLFWLSAGLLIVISKHPGRGTIPGANQFVSQ